MAWKSVKRRVKKAWKNMKGFQFSKLIILFETGLVAYVTYKVIGFVELAILCGYLGSLAFLTTLITAAYAAYGVSVAFYYNKSKAENTTGGITYALATAQPVVNQDIDCE